MLNQHLIKIKNSIGCSNVFMLDMYLLQLVRFFKNTNPLFCVFVFHYQATPNMSKEEEERSGLVSSHAYALLDMRKINGHKLVMLKNPWSHLEWKGNFSDYDTRNWTPELIKALDYDPKLQVDVDNGVFWIDYNSLCHYFENFYLNWSPSLFSYTSCIHNSWPARQGPVKDLYNLGDNPQYVLRLNPKMRASIWVC